MRQTTDDTATARRRGTTRFVVPELVWWPVSAGVLVLIPGLLGLATGYPLLFPSLGPTAALHAAHPRQPSARLYNTLVGHAVGVAAALLAVWLFGAATEPSILASSALHQRRLWASVGAIVVKVILQSLLRAAHPPAAATTLLITCGGFQVAWNDVAVIATGVVLVAFTGEVFRRWRLAQIGPE